LAIRPGTAGNQVCASWLTYAVRKNRSIPWKVQSGRSPYAMPPSVRKACSSFSIERNQPVTTSPAPTT
jgi:hypothetical protein